MTKHYYQLYDMSKRPPELIELDSDGTPQKHITELHEKLEELGYAPVGAHEQYLGIRDGSRDKPVEPGNKGVMPPGHGDEYFTSRRYIYLVTGEGRMYSGMGPWPYYSVQLQIYAEIWEAIYEPDGWTVEFSDERKDDQGTIFASTIPSTIRNYIKSDEGRWAREWLTFKGVGKIG